MTIKGRLSVRFLHMAPHPDAEGRSLSEQSNGAGGRHRRVTTWIPTTPMHMRSGNRWIFGGCAR